MMIKLRVVLALTIGVVFAPTSHAAELPADPLNSVMWEHMAKRFFPGDIVFDQRVKVSAPHSAEDQFQVPITVDATALDDVVEIVALADLNPIPHILTMRPVEAQAFLGFRVKLQQATPIRVGVKTSDGVWHVNGVVVDAAGGGCTAPAMAHGISNWMKSLGSTRAIAHRETGTAARVSLRIRHPMDTGLADGIPVFYMSDMQIRGADNRILAAVDLYEPVSENPTLTLKPLIGDTETEVNVSTRDTEGHEFNFALAVPLAASN